MDIEKIIVIADPLRHKSGQDGNADMFFGIVHGILGRICDIPVRLLEPDELVQLQKEFYAAYGHDIEKYQVHSSIFGGVPVQIWQDLCFAQPNEHSLALTEKYFKNSLVICREPSYIIKRCLKRLNIPIIEMAIHSVRYLDDLMLGFTSNMDAVYERLKAHEADKELFYFHADLLKAEAYRRWSYFHGPIQQKSAVFFAQTPVDRSLLDFENKKLVSFMDYSERFKKLTKEYEVVYYKPHPHYKDPAILAFVKNFKNVKILEDDISTYDLLSFKNVEKCVTISSGTINEARYFGKQTECYLGQPYHYSDEEENKALLNKDLHYISIYKEYLTAAFWADILSPIISVRKVSILNSSLISNKMRRIIGSSWGYNDNDSCSVTNELKKLKEEIRPVIKNEKMDTKGNYTVFFLGFIPLLKYRKGSNVEKYKFLCNIFELKKYPGKTKFEILGIPLVKIYTQPKNKISLKQKIQKNYNKIKIWRERLADRHAIQADLLIMDNFEPSFLKTGFRVTEFNYLLRSIKNTYLLSFSDKIYKYSDFAERVKNRDIQWNTPMNYKTYCKKRNEYFHAFPDLKGKLLYMNGQKCSAKGAYVMFLYNAYLSAGFFEENHIPFVFTLFPGGGFMLNHAFSDHMLQRVCCSPMLRGIYCPQQIVYDYVKKYIPEEKLFYRYGGGFFQMTKSDVVKKQYYKKEKNTFDIAFVAYKYMPKGLDKGFDLFLAAATILVRKYPFVHFHNVGTHTLADFEESFNTLPNLHHYGSQKTSFFPEFYSKMDIVLSPNRSNVLRPGAFDGFPLAVEGAYCGAALFCSNPMNCQTKYQDKKHLVIVQPRVEDIVEKIEYYMQHLSELYTISQEGQKLTQDLFDIDKQKRDRMEFIEKYLSIKENTR